MKSLKRIFKLLLLLLIALMLVFSTRFFKGYSQLESSMMGVQLPEEDPYPSFIDSFSPANYDSETSEAYVEVNNSIPLFCKANTEMEPFESYSELDNLGRCGVAFANVGIETMPTEVRGNIGMIKPSGWHTIRYDDLIADHYLYNRCHLIAYQLSGENDNPCNLITGTRYLNIAGMLPFEDKVADYIKATNNHVLYRATPIFEGSNLVASGVVIEAYSVEDNGDGICFAIYAFNVQPGISIDYLTGNSEEAVDFDQTNYTRSKGIETSKSDTNTKMETSEQYIGNIRSKVYHIPTCANLPKESNRVLFDTSDEAESSGYRPCGNCLPQKAA